MTTLAGASAFGAGTIGGCCAGGAGFIIVVVGGGGDEDDDCGDAGVGFD